VSGATPQPPAEDQAVPARRTSDSDRDTAVQLIVRIRVLSDSALSGKETASGHARGKNRKLHEAGMVWVDRATLDEIGALSTQVEIMLRRGRP
jgi:hypothetical protein